MQLAFSSDNSESLSKCQANYQTLSLKRFLIIVQCFHCSPDYYYPPVACIILLSDTQAFLINWRFAKEQGPRLSSLTPWLF